MSFFRRNQRRALGAAGGLAALSSVLLSGTAFGGQAEILWDQFGIPHIYGPDLLTVVRGLGYAEMENHAETILMNVAAARGQSAQYFGPGDNNANIANDMLVLTEGIPDRATAWSLDPRAQDQQAILQAFADGVNEYAQRHGDTIDPSIHAVLPFLATDVLAGIQNTVHFHFMPEQDNIPALISAWQNGGKILANAVACSFTPLPDPACPTSSGGPAVAATMTHGGSNGWAIAPGKSASGNAILMGNPHLPWGNNIPIPPSEGLGLGIYQLMEVNLVIGPPGNPNLNASGVVFMGAPFIAIGYSDKIGWTHTNNTIQNTNLYELTLNSDGTYNFGTGTQPLQFQQKTIQVLGQAAVPVDIYTSVYGPIIALSNDRTKALALRVAGLDQPSAVTQYWNMIQAQNWDDFTAAISALQMPFFNVIYADQDGDIFYLFGGRQPKRNGGSWGKYSGILDGSDPSLLWTDTFAFTDLPQAINPLGGFVANSNNPPWTSAFSAFPSPTPTNDPANFPAYVSPQFMDLRAQNGAIKLQSKTTLSVADVLAAKEWTHVLLADRVLDGLDGLIAAAQQYPSPIAPNPLATAAAAVLNAWDRNADATSKGAVLFEMWWNLVTSQISSSLCPPSLQPLPTLALDNTINFYSPHPQFWAGWDPNHPLATPNGLANAAATVPYLICAATLVLADYGGALPNVQWGAAHNVVLATRDSTYQTPIPLTNMPQSGADDRFGPLRVLFPAPENDGIHFFPVSGDGYVQLVEFTNAGANAQALLGYGNASRPNSPHITDQLQYFEAKTLRPVYRARQDVEAHTVLREVVY
jgi:acyl-homoserine-lactone acylase